MPVAPDLTAGACGDRPDQPDGTEIEGYEMGWLGRKQSSAPSGVRARNGHWETDPGPHTCEFSGGHQINATTVRMQCTHCPNTKDVRDPAPRK